MKIYRSLLAITVISLSGITNYSYGDAGSDPYSPTKLEWLITELNARYRQGELLDFGWEISFVAVSPDTVNIIYQGKSAPYRTNQLDVAVSQVSDLAKAKGWNWVQITKSDVTTPEPDIISATPPPPKEEDKYATMSTDELFKLKVDLKKQCAESARSAAEKQNIYRRIEMAYKSATSEEAIAAIADEYHQAKKDRDADYLINQENNSQLRYVEGEIEKRFPGGSVLTATNNTDTSNHTEIAEQQTAPPPNPGTHEYYDQFVKGKYLFRDGEMEPFSVVRYKREALRALKDTINIPGTLDKILPDGRVLVASKDTRSSGIEQDFYAVISLINPTTNSVGDKVSYTTIIDESRIDANSPEKGHERITTSNNKEVSAFVLAEFNFNLPALITFEQYMEIYNRELSDAQKWNF